ncbi:peptide chain release factor N(5)-glutamine methyltransferase [Christiangramia sp. SM2212]|uniref:Release factor glutamine methyltransferase n=1 Tax=Christiangramia sediminicola TaxID=3073267 RepID=A0ABU1EMZ7_9FLAO|nr:peptide chain release factor N(5)-glutamine methyltransferase [Christiangramia sp. SM2212]MDR5589770.1 peptide chain release factor N(5)-glutamine methyltransferase [Christiangramia sp. SM2212]
MQLSHIKLKFEQELKNEFPLTEIGSFFYILTEEFSGKKRIDVALDPHFELSEELRLKFEKALERLKLHEPIQYITGNTEFYGRKFLVNKNVLIPRPETEELVGWIVSDHQKDKNLKVLDIGTGTGCIPISLKMELENANISTYDISSQAIELARKNAELNSAEIQFSELNILETKKLDQKFDIIVSNPPYVRELEKDSMQKNVLKHEPDLALYVADNDALIFYRKITQLAKESLKEGGKLYFEINQYLSEETKLLVEQFGFEAELKKDIFGNYRMLKAVKL